MVLDALEGKDLRESSVRAAKAVGGRDLAGLWKLGERQVIGGKFSYVLQRFANEWTKISFCIFASSPIVNYPLSM